MFRAMFSPIVSSTLLYLQHLVVFTQVAAGWFMDELKLYMFRAMFSPIVRSTWLYLQHLVVFTQVAAGWFMDELKLYVFRAMFSPIIRSTWLHLQVLVVCTQVAAGWCHGWVETLHVSDDIFAHHQEHLTVFTGSVSMHPSCCRLVSWMSWNCPFNSSMTAAGSNLGEYYQKL